MFTGIIESLGTIEDIQFENSNVRLTIRSAISGELKIDQSVAHNGVCLTVVQCDSNTHQVIAVDETMRKTSIGNWKKGDLLNLERCMQANGRFDGHIVQGHVDAIAKVKEIKDEKGSWLFTFEFDAQFAPLIVEKGSVCINGTSLTCFHIGINTFNVAIIPYTYEHTNFHQLIQGSIVNIEFDIIGKYISRMHNLTSH